MYFAGYDTEPSTEASIFVVRGSASCRDGSGGGSWPSLWWGRNIIIMHL